MGVQRNTLKRICKWGPTPVKVNTSESSFPLDSLVEALEVSAIVVVTVVAVVCAVVSVVVVSSEGGLMRSQPQDFAQCLAMYSRFLWHAPILAHTGQNRWSSMHGPANTLVVCNNKASKAKLDIFARSLCSIMRGSSQNASVITGNRWSENDSPTWHEWFCNKISSHAFWLLTLDSWPNAPPKWMRRSSAGCFHRNQSRASTSTKVKRCWSSLGRSDTFLMKTCPLFPQEDQSSRAAATKLELQAILSIF